MNDERVEVVLKCAALMERCIQDFIDLQGTDPSIEEVDEAITNLFLAKEKYKTYRENNFAPVESRLL